MSETNSREQLNNIKLSICDTFEKNITDDNIRQYILGESRYSQKAVINVARYVQYIKNILHLSFYFVYACYKYDINYGDCVMESLENPNAKRVERSLKSTFINYPITLDLIQFVLTDIMFELSQGYESELKPVFGEMFDANNETFSFTPYFKLIADYDKKAAKFMLDQTMVAELLKNLLDKITFLKQYSLRCSSDKPDDFYFVHKNSSDTKEEERKEVRHIFFRDTTKYYGNIYYLYGIDYKKGHNKTKVDLKYLSSSLDQTPLIFNIPDDSGKSDHLKNCDIINEITGQNLSNPQAEKIKSKNSNVIEHIHTVNYKYIKNLALSISDVISATDNNKEKIYMRFYKQYPYIFEKTSGTDKSSSVSQNSQNLTAPPIYKDPDLNWDTIIIMLLIEASPSVFLEFLFSDDSKIRDIGRNLYKRVYEPENFAIFNSNKNVIENEVKNFARQNLVVGESAGFGKIKKNDDISKKLYARAAAMLIISKLTILQEEEGKNDIVYSGNLHSNIKLLKDSNDSPERKLNNSCIILGETLKHMICFYSGLIVYGDEKYERYDKITYDKCLVEKEIKGIQDDLEAIFLKAASEKAASMKEYQYINTQAVINLLNEFIDFCENAEKNHSNNLYSVTGKHNIISTDIIKAFRDDFAAEAKNPYDIDADKWVTLTLKTLEYLKTGSFSDTPMDTDLFNAIYPFTATFNRKKENLDGYETVNFSLNIDIEEDTQIDYHTDINVLSEFTYNRNEVYYCLPNVLRSNYKWWIDPLLIDFKKFNDIFKDEGNDNT